MKISNIQNNCNFGQVIKVNAPLQVAQRAVTLINSKEVKKKEADSQGFLKAIFYDTDEDKGIARAIAITPKKNESYIVSGEESEAIANLENFRNRKIEAAKEKHGEKSPQFQTVKDRENQRYDALLKNIIYTSRKEIELDLEYSKRKNKIRSVDIII